MRGKRCSSAGDRVSRDTERARPEGTPDVLHGSTLDVSKHLDLDGSQVQAPMLDFLHDFKLVKKEEEDRVVFMFDPNF
jgi:hypothetical protein